MTDAEMIETAVLRGISNSLVLMRLRDQVHELQLEIYKLKNPNYTEIELLTYKNELLEKIIKEMKNGD